MNRIKLKLIDAPHIRFTTVQFILHTFKNCKLKYVNFIKEYMIFIVYCSLKNEQLFLYLY